MEVCQKPKNRFTIWSSSPTPGRISKQNYNLKRQLQSHIIAVLFTTDKTCKQPKRPLMDEWIYTHNGILFSHKKKILHLWQHGWTLKAFMLTETSKLRKTNTVWTHIHWEFKKTKLIEIETRFAVVRDGGIRWMWSEVWTSLVREISSRDVMYNMMIYLTVLYFIYWK